MLCPPNLTPNPTHPNADLLATINTKLILANKKLESLAAAPVEARGDILKMLLELFKELLPIILPLLIEPHTVPDAT